MDPCLKRNYSYSYKENDDLCFLTGYFGLRVNASNLFDVKFAKFIDGDSSGDGGGDDDDVIPSYLEAPKADSTTTRMNEQLEVENLSLEILVLGENDENDHDRQDEEEEDGTYYRVTSAGETRLWESGMICQHYDFKKVLFRTKRDNKSANDNEDVVELENCSTTLYILVWPDTITFTMELILEDKSHLKSTGLNMKIKFGKKWQIEHTFNASDCDSNPKCKVSLHCNLNDCRKMMMIGDDGRSRNIHVDCSFVDPKQDMTTDFSDHFNCYLLAKNGLIDRSFQSGYTDIRDYDLFYIKLNNSTDKDTYVPILLFVQYLANPTGLCPIICDMNYEPTGIPIQLSKNWHSQEIKNYGRFYSLLPVNANNYAEYYVRIPYGFYGTLPTASHANLSLIGYFGHGTRWEQLAIGCFGETYCLDLDMGCVKQTLTDIRMLFTKGEDEKLWNWSDAGWGGDWLQVYNNGDQRLMPFSWKTAYESHGPCLTCMHVDGWYQSSNEDRVELSSIVRTLRTDDYARTFTQLSYIFKNDLPTAKTHLFSVGGAADIATPKIAFGCKDGLIEEIHVDEDVDPDSYFIERKVLTGPSPWFVGFPGQMQINDKTWGKGFRALIIRRYEASFNSVKYHNPCISLVGLRKSSNIRANLRLAISPEVGIEYFKSGDSVEFEVELITLPKQAEDYYGPNEEFRSHLVQYEDSWRMIHRETIRNDIYPKLITGGVLKSKYPLIVSVTNEFKVTVEIEGGVGACPLRFEGLQTTKYYLYQIVGTAEQRFSPEVHGNDFWQTDFDTTKLFSLTFNIPLSEKVLHTTWELRRSQTHHV